MERDWIVVTATPEYMELPDERKELIRADLREALRQRVKVMAGRDHHASTKADDIVFLRRSE